MLATAAVDTTPESVAAVEMAVEPGRAECTANWILNRPTKMVQCVSLGLFDAEDYPISFIAAPARWN